jgi:hypothetical protein
MNHKKIYDQIIDRAKSREKLQGYKERHHIIPKCMGGSNYKENIAELTDREHCISHWLLYEMHPKNYKLATAFWNMCGVKNNRTQQRYVPSSRVIEYARKALSESRKGIKFSEEHLAKIRRVNIGRKQPKEQIENRRKSLIGQKRGEEARKNIIRGLTGRKSFRKGGKLDEDHKKKISDAKKGIPTWIKGKKQNIIKCDVCGKTGGNSMHRWHFKNCKNKG